MSADLVFHERLALKIRQMRWTPQDSSGALASPWTGYMQAVAGMLQRWQFTAEFHSLDHEEAGLLHGFLMRCQGPVKTFSFWDPVRWRPRGQWVGNPQPVLDGNHSARARVIKLRGFQANLFKVIAAGDWLTINEQLCAATADALSDGEGKIEIEIFPRLMRNLDDGAEVQWLRAPGIFRLTNTDATMTAVAGRKSPYSIQQFSAVQDLLLP